MDTVIEQTTSRIDNPILLFCIVLTALVIAMFGLVLKDKNAERKEKNTLDRARVQADVQLAEAVAGLKTVLEQKVVASSQVDNKLDTCVENGQTIINMLTRLSAKI